MRQHNSSKLETIDMPIGDLVRGRRSPFRFFSTLRLGLKTCDVLGYSLGRMIAQQMAQDRPVHLSEDDPRCYRAAGWRGYHTS
jgi:hypothetical protein